MSLVYGGSTRGTVVYILCPVRAGRRCHVTAVARSQSGRANQCGESDCGIVMRFSVRICAGLLPLSPSPSLDLPAQPNDLTAPQPAEWKMGSQEDIEDRHIAIALGIGLGIVALIAICLMCALYHSRYVRRTVCTDQPASRSSSTGATPAGRSSRRISPRSCASWTPCRRCARWSSSGRASRAR